MSEEDKGLKVNVYFKSKARYKLFKAICKELDTNISERLNDLVEDDLGKMIAIIQALKEVEVKTDVKDN